MLRWRTISKVQVFTNMHGESLSNGRKTDRISCRHTSLQLAVGLNGDRLQTPCLYVHMQGTDILKTAHRDIIRICDNIFAWLKLLLYTTLTLFGINTGSSK